MASSRSSASRTLLPFFSMCGSGDARTCPLRWLLNGAAATLVLYSERCSSLLRHVCCSMACARARLPWRSSRRPDSGDEETRRAVGFVVHVASVCPTRFRCLTRILQGFRADVAKVDLDFWNCGCWTPTQSFDSRCCNCLFSNVATTFNIFFMLQILILDVADVEFWCCKYVVCCVGGSAHDVGCCNH
jgi:hypothetical protein